METKRKSNNLERKLSHSDIRQHNKENARVRQRKQKL